MKRAPYSAYKAIGAAWLGRLPAHWELVPLGFLVRFCGGATPDKARPEYWDGSIPWVSPKDMKQARLSDAEDHVSDEALQASPLSMVPVGAVLVVVRGMILAHSFPVALAEAPLTINQDMKAMLPAPRLDARFLAWTVTGLAKAVVALADESAHGTRKLETETLARLPMPVPPLDEQREIVSYLDSEMADLDMLVQRKRALIEKLKEKRASLIAQTVTRGLPPDAARAAGLHPDPKLKPSGIEWLGDVPVHWGVKKITEGFRKIASGTTPKSDSEEYYEGDIPWVTTSELRETVIRETNQTVTRRAIEDHPALKIYPAGTVLFAMYGATIGRLGILGIPATVNQACCAFAWPTRFDTRFVFYWLWMRREVLASLSVGGGQPNLSQDDLRRLRIPTPPVNEQSAIADFLDRETGWRPA